MSRYTTELRYICESYASAEKSTEYSSVEDIIRDSVNKVFDFDYPIFDENYRNVLNTKIIRHFFTREIGFETVGLWKLKLNTKMNEIMPYYNKLYESEALHFDPLHDFSYTRSGNRSGSKNGEYGETVGVHTTRDISDNTKTTLDSKIVENGTEGGTVKVDKTGTNSVQDNKSNVIDTNGTVTVEHSGTITSADTGSINGNEKGIIQTNDTGTVIVTNEGDVKTAISNNQTTDTYVLEQGTNENTTDVYDLYSDTPQNRVLTQSDIDTNDGSYLTNNRFTRTINNGNTNNTVNTNGTVTDSSDKTVTHDTTNTKTLNTANKKDINVDNTKTLNTTNTKTMDNDDTETTDMNKTETLTGTSTETKNLSDLETRALTDSKNVSRDDVTDVDRFVSESGDRDSEKNGTNKVNSMEEYLETYSGKRGTASYSKLLKEFRETFLNIDMMIIGQLDDLFMQLW